MTVALFPPLPSSACLEILATSRPQYPICGLGLTGVALWNNYCELFLFRQRFRNFSHSSSSHRLAHRRRATTTPLLLLLLVACSVMKNQETRTTDQPHPSYPEISLRNLTIRFPDFPPARKTFPQHHAIVQFVVSGFYFFISGSSHC